MDPVDLVANQRSIGVSPESGGGEIRAGGPGPLEGVFVYVAAVNRPFQYAVTDAGQRQLHDDVGRGCQHCSRVDQIDHPGRPPRWAQPHEPSTPPCETLAACLRRCVPAGRPASRPASWPTWRSAIPGADTPLRCSAGARPDSNGSHTPTTGWLASFTQQPCSVCSRSVVSRGSGSPTGGDPGGLPL